MGGRIVRGEGEGPREEDRGGRDGKDKREREVNLRQIGEEFVPRGRIRGYRKARVGRISGPERQTRRNGGRGGPEDPQELQGGRR